MNETGIDFKREDVKRTLFDNINDSIYYSLKNNKNNNVGHLY